jgi:peptidoglycan/LPS O-acetylase OafA/YrhL
MLKRSVRLDPPYWVAIAIAIALSLLASALVKDRANDSFTPGQVVAHILYVQEFLRIKEINPVFWTLCLEVQFYLVFAALLLTRSRAVVLLAFTVSLIWPLRLMVAPPGLFVGLWYGFLLGAGSYFAWQQRRARPWFYAYAGILILRLSYLGDVFGLACCATALTIHIVARVNLIGTILNWRWIQFLGMISYSLYLLHNPITGATFRVGFILTGRSIVTEAIWWGVSICACIAAATALYYAVEKPSIRLSRAIGARRAPSTIFNS